MIFAKLIDSTRVIPCPRNGYVDGKAVSNLNRFFERNPEIAEKEGYMELIPFEGETEKEMCYIIKHGKIIEGVMEDDN